ncbi:group II intron maturase-specific domain-containing protein, partial [Alkalibacterium sp. m-11]
MSSNSASYFPAPKQRFREKLKKLTRRNRPGSFKDIVTDINRVTVGWINYYKIA